jgi:hypothetical protein
MVVDVGTVVDMVVDIVEWSLTLVDIVSSVSKILRFQKNRNRNSIGKHDKIIFDRKCVSEF